VSIDLYTLACRVDLRGHLVDSWEEPEDTAVFVRTLGWGTHAWQTEEAPPPRVEPWDAHLAEGVG